MTRRCPVCGASLEGRRSDARYCSGACRVEGWRIGRLLRGEQVGRYRTLRDRAEAFGRGRRSRTHSAGRGL